MIKKTAIAAAQAFIKKQNFSNQYLTDSPKISETDKEFHVEFRDKQRNVKPGVCIIVVDKSTGNPRLEPVE